MIYKTLVAAAEEPFREGIAGALSSDAELRIVARADNGKTALEKAREHLPDLLFVDINMPAMNGLELIERAQSFLKGAVFIITGCGNFDYIRESIRLGVFDYLLKPVAGAALLDAVARAKERVRENRGRINYDRWARAQIEKNLPALRAAFAGNWMAGRCGESEIAEQLEYLGIEISSPCGVTVARAAISGPAEYAAQGWDENLLSFAVENIARETFAGLAPVFSYKSDLGDIVLISSCEPEPLWTRAGGELAEALEANLPVSVALAQEARASREALPEAYMTALEGLKANVKRSNLAVKAKDYVLRNLGDANLSLRSAAAHCYVSSGHLSRTFRNELGVTFSDFLSQTRIRMAAGLLLNSDLKIHEIAHKTGYSTQHYFSVFFKRTFGVSPAEFRKSAASAAHDHDRARGKRVNPASACQNKI